MFIFSVKKVYIKKAESKMEFLFKIKENKKISSFLAFYDNLVSLAAWIDGI